MIAFFRPLDCGNITNSELFAKYKFLNDIYKSTDLYPRPSIYGILNQSKVYNVDCLQKNIQIPQTDLHVAIEMLFKILQRKFAAPRNNKAQFLQQQLIKFRDTLQDTEIKETSDTVHEMVAFFELTPTSLAGVYMSCKPSQQVKYCGLSVANLYDIVAIFYGEVFSHEEKDLTIN